MRLSKFISFGLVPLLLLFSSQSSATRTSHAHLVGVNQSRIMWMKHDERVEVLTNIAEHKVSAVRIPLNEPFAGTLEAIELAKQRNLPVLLVVSLNTLDFYPVGEEKRSAPKKLGVSYRLSQIDPERFRAKFEVFWNELEARNLTLLGLELGNEINWTFNGDIAVHHNKPGNVYRSVSAMPQGQRFVEGLENYIELLRIVRQIRDGSKVNQGMKLLSAGLANVRPEFAAYLKADFVDAGLTYRLLKQRGLSSIVDAAAIHYYPPPSMSVSERAELLSDVLDACAESGATGACWITEWGVNSNHHGCSEDESSRIDLVEETRRALDEAASNGQLSADFFFEWDGRTLRSIWRCNTLTPTGRAALDLID